MARHLYAEERGGGLLLNPLQQYLVLHFDALGGSVTAVNQRNWR